MAQKNLEILECKPVYTGTNNQGAAYTIHEVMARDPATGIIVQQPLRSFENLPLGVNVYLISKYEQAGKPTTYTLKAPKSGGGGGGGGGQAQVISQLQTRVEMLEHNVDALQAAVAAMRAAANPQLPPSPAPVAVPVGGADPFGGDDDIPF